MEELYLKKIELEDEERVVDYIRELVAFGSNTNGLWYEDSESYEEMLYNLRRHEGYVFTHYEQENVPCFQFLLVRRDDDRMVGSFSIRPYLTKSLDETYGGNIGYSIRPTERRQGYASLGLKLAISKCREYNPKSDIILCCYKDNIGSRKTIIKNGGELIEEKRGILTEEKYKIGK